MGETDAWLYSGMFRRILDRSVSQVDIADTHTPAYGGHPKRLN